MWFKWLTCGSSVTQMTQMCFKRLQMWCKCDPIAIQMWFKWIKCDSNVIQMIQMWLKCDSHDSNVIQVIQQWFKCDSNVIQMGFKCDSNDSNVIQMWFKWFKCDTRKNSFVIYCPASPLIQAELFPMPAPAPVWWTKLLSPSVPAVLFGEFARLRRQCAGQVIPGPRHTRGQALPPAPVVLVLLVLLVSRCVLRGWSHDAKGRRVTNEGAHQQRHEACSPEPRRRQWNTRKTPLLMPVTQKPKNTRENQCVSVPSDPKTKKRQGKTNSLVIRVAQDQKQNNGTPIVW